MLDLNSEVTQLIDDKVNKDEMFTAYDITKDIRSKVGMNIKVMHDDVKNEVHSIMLSKPAYTRTLANISGVSPPPWIYHPTQANPFLYGQPVQNSISQIVLPDYHNVDARGTLCIPVKITKITGFNYKDTVYVTKDNKSLIVSKNGTDNPYIVNKNGNIRISRSVLHKISYNNCFRIENKNNDIIISE